jgi:hypothetical protein
MGTAWEQHGHRMGTTWAPHLNSMGTAWEQHGHRMVTAWAPQGTAWYVCIGLKWDFTSNISQYVRRL